MTNNNDCRDELKEAAGLAFDGLAALGIDGAEFSISSGRMDEFNIEAGKFTLLRTTFNSSFAARVLSGRRKGVAATNSLEPGAVRKALEQAADAAKSSAPDDAEFIAEGIGEHEFKLGASGCNLDGIYQRLSEFLSGCGELYPKIETYQLISRYSSSSSLYANTNGTRAYTDAARYGHSATVCARDGERVSSMNGFGFSEEALNAPFLQSAEVRRILAETERQIDTSPVGGKFAGTVLIAPDCLGELLFSIIGNCVTDTPLIAGSSPWLGRLGEAVADARLSISLDPLDPRIVCGARVTGDGYLVRPQDIIRGGALAGWALSQYGAAKTGLARAGNVSGSLVVAAGDQTFEEILSGIEHGLLINRFSGGSPSQNGDFSGVAKNSFLISGGQIAGAVSETMVSGNLLDMIRNLSGLGREAVCDGGSAVPWAAFDGITISGK